MISNETIQPQNNSILISEEYPNMTRSIDIQSNQSDVFYESYQPITTVAINGFDQSTIVNVINTPMASFDLWNPNQSAVCIENSTSNSPGTNKTVCIF